MVHSSIAAPGQSATANDTQARIQGDIQSMQAPAVYRFEGFELDTLRRRLTGPDGSACPLSSRGYDALLYLVENRARVVGKDELMKAVWPRTVVEENNLNQAVSSARRALGDNRDAPRFILTVAGRGYQFVGEIWPTRRSKRTPTTCASAWKAPRRRRPRPLWKQPRPPSSQPSRNRRSIRESRHPTVSAAAESRRRAAAPATSPTSTAGIGRRRLLLALGAGAAAIAAGVYGWRRTSAGPDPTCRTPWPCSPSSR